MSEQFSVTYSSINIVDSAHLSELKYDLKMERSKI